MQNNVELIQQSFGEFAKGNIQAIIDRCADDVVWGSFDNPGVPTAGTFKGKNGVSKFFKLLSENVELADFTPKEFYGQGDTVIVRGRQSGKAKKTGRSFGGEWAMFFNLRDGKVTSYFIFLDTREQAQAFGLPVGAGTERQYERHGESIPGSVQAEAPRRSK